MMKMDFINCGISIAFSALINEARSKGYKLGLIIHKEFFNGHIQGFNVFDPIHDCRGNNIAFSKASADHFKKYKDLPHANTSNLLRNISDNYFRFSDTRYYSNEDLGIDSYELDKFGR